MKSPEYIKIIRLKIIASFQVLLIWHLQFFNWELAFAVIPKEEKWKVKK